MKEALCACANELGFDLCRIAKAVAPPHADAFRRWLSEGCAGEMTWLERNEQRRTDPRKILPGAKSVVVVALNYWQGPGQEQQSRDAGSKGRIARYAWG